MKTYASKLLALGLGLSVAGLSTQSARAAGTWDQTTGGSWGLNTNWDDDLVAGGAGATVTFPAINITAPTAITLDGDRTVGILNLSGSSTAASGNVNWNIASGTGGSLIFDNGVTDAQLNAVNRFSPGIAAAISLNSNLQLNKSGAGSTTLNITGGITATGKTVTINGTGTGQAVSLTGTTSFTGGSWVINNAIFNMNTGFKGDGTTTVTIGTGSGDSGLTLSSATLVAANTITVSSGGTSRILRNASGTTTTGSIVLDGEVTAVNASGATFNLAGATGATITGTGGINVATATGSGGAVTIAGAASHTGTNTVTGGNFTVSATGSLNGSSTVINTGRTFTTADNSSYTFDVGANGVNDSITGVGTANLNGDFVFNLSLADTTAGNSWLIVDVGTLTESFTGTFFVANAGAVETANVWSFTNAGTLYEFSELTGRLTISSPVPEPSTYATLAGLAVLGFVSVRRRRG